MMGLSKELAEQLSDYAILWACRRQEERAPGEAVDPDGLVAAVVAASAAGMRENLGKKARLVPDSVLATVVEGWGEKLREGLPEGQSPDFFIELATPAAEAFMAEHADDGMRSAVDIALSVLP